VYNILNLAGHLVNMDRFVDAGTGADGSLLVTLDNGGPHYAISFTGEQAEIARAQLLAYAGFAHAITNSPAAVAVFGHLKRPARRRGSLQLTSESEAPDRPLSDAAGKERHPE
jgi:hypothetical protein